MLKHCRNLVQLSVSTSKLNYGQLATAIEPMKNLERLDVSLNGSISLLLLISARLKELMIREKVKKTSYFDVALDL